MATRRAIHFFVLGVASAMGGGCVQHMVADQSPARVVSQEGFSAQVPHRQALVATRLRAASRKHTPFATKAIASRRDVTTDGSVGIASFYKFDSKTASGERFNPSELTAAHRTLPFGTRLRVTNLVTGQSVTVRVNDRGPFIPGRVVDVSRSAAETLGMIDSGIATVRLEVQK